MSTLAVNTITNAAGGNTAQINGMTPTADSLQGFRNRIINGDMRISQRGTSFAGLTNGSVTYTVDRWQWAESGTFTGVLTVTQDSSAPSGFASSLKVQTTTAVASLADGEANRFEHKIEGLNSADLAWGTADAKPVTLSFWVRSSLTGTFGGALANSAVDRSYAFTYTISSADTWEYKTITVAGDTTGTWLTDNGIGIRVRFGLGVGSTFSGTAGAWVAADYQSATGAVSVVGTLNATWYLTGVQLEAGSTATPFERRPYGTELALCQRYYYRLTNADAQRIAPGYAVSTTVAECLFQFPVPMRIAPTALETTGTAADYSIRYNATAISCSVVPAFATTSNINSSATFTVVSAVLTQGAGCFARPIGSATYFGWSAEL
jgi:hypothetical protein